MNDNVMDEQGQIFVNHAHVYPEDVLPQGSLDRLAEVVEICGIDRVVCFAPLPHSVVPVSDGTEWLAQALRRYPKFMGFGTLDFQQPNLRDQVGRITDLGLKGIKIHPSVQQVNMLGEDAFTVFDEAQKQGLPLAVHTGPIDGGRLKWFADPLIYDEISYSFPELKMIIEHVGGWSSCREMVGVIYNCNLRAGSTRVYASLSESFGIVRSGAPVEFNFTPAAPDFLSRNKGVNLGALDQPIFTREELERALMWIGEEAAVLGMDFPWLGLGPEQYQHDIQFVRNLRISERAKQMILGGNLARLLGET